MREDTVICKLCLEPIFNPLCISCQYKSISDFLQKRDKKLVEGFESFHKILEEKFSTEENRLRCIKCGNTSTTVICPYCYAKEAFLWLKERNLPIAVAFSKIFNYNFLGTEMREDILAKNLMPIVICEKREKSDTSICDLCGEPSDNLVERNGLWLCESCRED